jgi:hypothetical protein
MLLNPRCTKYLTDHRPNINQPKYNRVRFALQRSRKDLVSKNLPTLGRVPRSRQRAVDRSARG